MGIDLTSFEKMMSGTFCKESLQALLQVDGNCGTLTEVSAVSPEALMMTHLIQFDAQRLSAIQPMFVHATNCLWTPGASLRYV